MYHLGGNANPAGYAIGVDYKIRFWPRHEITLDYVVGRRVMLGLEAHKNTTNFAGYLVDSTIFEYAPLYTRTHSSKALGFTITTFALNGNPLAPLGNYLKFRFLRTTVMHVDSYVSGIPGALTINYNSWVIGMSVGKHRIIKNSLIINVAVNFDLILPPPNYALGPSLVGAYYNSYLQRYYFTFKLGVGGILF
ncbi:MAG: hypothetical protein M3Q97_09375 [Bacteroidota bacterium]|nr:hypothetical protein [Bacteroidota bacterium]